MKRAIIAFTIAALAACSVQPVAAQFRLKVAPIPVVTSSPATKPTAAAVSPAPVVAPAPAVVTVCTYQALTTTGCGLPGPVNISGEMTSNATFNVANGDTLFTSVSAYVTGPVVALRGMGTTGLLLTTGVGSQILSGTTGSDTLFGGAGIDVAEFSGKSTDYRISGIAPDIFLTPLQNLNIRDRAIYIEILRFSDGDFTWSPSTGLMKYTGTDAIKPSDPVSPVVTPAPRPPNC